MTTMIRRFWTTYSSEPPIGHRSRSPTLGLFNFLQPPGFHLCLRVGTEGQGALKEQERARALKKMQVVFDSEWRAKAIFTLLMMLGLCGFLFLCVTWTVCGQCYIEPCCVPPDDLDVLGLLYHVNSSLCFGGTTTGLFFCFLAGWGAILTLKRRASVMGFGHFFGAACVTILVAVQSAGMWGAELRILERLRDSKPEAICADQDADDYDDEVVTLRPNHNLRQATQFLFSMSVIISIIVIALAPLYFVSRDVYDDSIEPSMSSLASLARSRSVRSGRISKYEPIRDNASDDETQYLGRAQIPMRPIRPQYKPVDTGVDHAVDGI